MVDGREELLAEMATAPSGLREFVVTEFQALLRHPDFSNVLPGIVSQSTRAGWVLQRLAAIAQLPGG